jgi:uncharacterized protein (TIGR03067 family)
MPLGRRHVCAVLALGAVGALGACATAPTAPPRSTGLTGKWAPVTAVLGGKPFPLVTLRGPLLLTADRFEFGGDKGVYTVLSRGRPGQMNIRSTEGRHAGREIPAIFELNGNELLVAYQLGNGARPNDFTSPENSRILVMRYQRIE